MSENERERLAQMCDEQAVAADLHAVASGSMMREKFRAEAADWRTIAAILRSAPAGQRIEGTALDRGNFPDGSRMGYVFYEGGMGTNGLPWEPAVLTILHAAPEAGGGGGSANDDATQVRE